MRRGMPEVWHLIKPLALYYVGYYVVYFLLGTFLNGRGLGLLLQENRAVVGGICMLGGCAALFSMAGEERELQQKERKRNAHVDKEDTWEQETDAEGIVGQNINGVGRKEQQEQEGQQEKRKITNVILSYFLLAVYAVSALVFFNMLTSMLGLSGKSNTFQQVAESQYAVSLGMGLFLYAGISAVSEELLFRYLLYNRLRRYSDKVLFGAIASSFLFAVYHGNIVQGSYAFVSGLLITLSYIYFESFYAPVLFHGIGNAVIFICNKVESIYGIFFNPVSFVLFGIITVVGTGYMIRKRKTVYK